MRRTITLLAAMALTLGLMAAPALATHGHHLQTPGTCIDGIGAGQDHAPGHDWAPGQGKFVHSGLHVGTPGTLAFGKGGKVSVDGGDCPS